MKKLSSIARTTEVDDTSDRLLQLYSTETAVKDDTFLKPLFAELQTLSDKITEAIKKDKILSELDDTDAVRDEAVKKLFKIVDGYAAMPMENFHQPGAKLKAILDKFGVGIIRQNYASESSYIESMLQDLSAFSTEIAALPGVAEAIAAVRAAQTDFTTKRVNYEKTLSTEKQDESASAVKKPLLELINNKLVPYLDTMKMVDAAKFTNFTDAAAQIIANTNSVVSQRASMKSTKKDQPAP